MNNIVSFTGEYRWLSNFYPCSVKIDGIVYGSSEAAFMAEKTFDLLVKIEFAGLSAKAARAYGQMIKLRPDWRAYRLLAMTRVLYAKFTQNAELKQKLLATQNALLIEGNNYGDTFWGKVQNNNGELEGQNMLGKSLMLVRDMLRGTL